MKKTKILIITAAVLIILTASLSSYFQARQQYKSPTEFTAPSVTLKNTPDTFNPNTPIELTWEVETASPYNITDSTIFYDTVATPSALTPNDSPEQVGYHYSIPDYRKGLFTSPETFTANLTPPDNASVIYLRGYAKLDNHHYWTSEYTLKLE